MRDPTRAYSDNETVGIATWNLCVNGLRDACLVKLAQRVTPEEREELTGIVDRLTVLFGDVFTRDPDVDHIAGLKRRMDCMRLHVSHADITPKEYVVLDMGDAQTLCGPALDRCDLECPCVTVDEETGERTVIREAVRRCEMAKVYKRMMLKGKGSFAECPYSMI